MQVSGSKQTGSIKRNQMRKINSVFVWLLLLATSGTMTYLYFIEKANSKRLFDNVVAANSKIKEFTTRDGHQATKKQAYELTNSELRKAFPEVQTQLKNLYIKPRLAESYTQASTAMEFEVSAPTRDTLVNRLRRDIQDTLPALVKLPVPELVEGKTFSYSDQWKSVNGLVFPDTTFIKVAAVDSIFTAIYRGQRRHPWAWVLSKRKLEVAATNRNPDIKITVIQAGLIKK